MTVLKKATSKEKLDNLLSDCKMPGDIDGNYH